MYKIKTEYFYKASEVDVAMSHYNNLIESDADASMYANSEGIMITVVTLPSETQDAERDDSIPVIDEWSGD